jgi:hypothetical protein
MVATLDCALRAAVRRQSVCTILGGFLPSHASFLGLTLHSVTFEEYIYYAKIAREREKHLPEVEHKTSFFKTLFGKSKPITIEFPPSPIVPQNNGEKGATPEDFGVVVDEEWYQAARALRTATWGAVFYLITTDVLGPYSVP